MFIDKRVVKICLFATGKLISRMAALVHSFSRYVRTWDCVLQGHVGISWDIPGYSRYVRTWDCVLQGHVGMLDYRDIWEILGYLRM